MKMPDNTIPGESLWVWEVKPQELDAVSPIRRQEQDTSIHMPDLLFPFDTVQDLNPGNGGATHFQAGFSLIKLNN